MRLVVAVFAGLIAGVALGLLFKFVPAIGSAIPADWHAAVIGGVAGALAVMAMALVRPRKT